MWKPLKKPWLAEAYGLYWEEVMVAFVHRQQGSNVFEGKSTLPQAECDRHHATLADAKARMEECTEAWIKQTGLKRGR